MDVIQRAVEAAQEHYSVDDWYSLRPQERTAAVYREIRRLDGAAAKAANISSRRASSTPSAGDTAPAIGLRRSTAVSG
jgi:hypothetical protein